MKYVCYLLTILFSAAVGFAQPALSELYEVTCHGKPPVICPNGLYPTLAPVQLADGNLYFVTWYGGQGANANGTVGKVSATGQGAVLYSFKSNAQGMFPQGALPIVSLVKGPGNELYGVTLEGGANNAGVMYKLSDTGEFQVLYNFCSHAGCPDGPAPLSLGKDGNFYGSSNAGVFRMTPTGIWSQVCSLSEPGPGMIVGSDGNFYGALIRVTPSCKVTRPSFQIEYGDSVSSPPILASDGNIYFGGVFRPNGFGVYRMNFSTKQVEFVYSTPDTFPVQLLQASDGNLWGLANYGETSTFFSITLGGDHFQLGSFDCKTTGCEPTGMVEGTDGNFYGIASYGGDPKSSGGDGGVFKIAAGLRQ